MTHPRFDNKLLSQAMNIFLHFSQSQNLSKTAHISACLSPRFHVKSVH